jgi:hypothetical protein
MESTLMETTTMMEGMVCTSTEDRDEGKREWRNARSGGKWHQ